MAEIRYRYIADIIINDTDGTAGENPNRVKAVIDKQLNQHFDAVALFGANVRIAESQIKLIEKE